MKQIFSLQGLSSVFNFIWKIWLVLNLAWIAHSLQVIADGFQFDDQPPEVMGSPWPQKGYDGVERAETCPRSDPST